MPFIPLEANPEVFLPLADELGLPLNKYGLHDVYGFDDELLAMVPAPTSAVIMLFPSPPRWSDSKRVAEDAESLKAHPISGRKDLVYFRQKISNACGTFALLHSLANAGVELRDGPYKTLFEQCKGLDPEESAALLAKTEIETSHQAASTGGQSEVPDPEAPVPLHFVAFVEHQGQLVELDGYGHEGPISHGPMTGDLLPAVVPVVKRMMEDSGSWAFNLMSLGPIAS